HTAEDEDYFRLELEDGYRYEITARANDSYNSGDGQSYTNDVLFGINDGSGWSELYDDVMPQSYVVDGPGTLTLGVSSYFVGTLGTYGLDLNVSRSVINSTTATELDPYLTVSPNPSQGPFNVDLQLPSAAEVQVRVQDINGRLLLQQDWGTQQQFNHELSLPNAAPGVYLLQVEVGGTTLRRRLVITK
ncbi:MAG: T9SS type A sorting domain-containing protein, partial [Bacteroidetes bacterium]|nr:T9SS type A sorting domain-containing protein [Bacteroidota bacterium]